MKEPHTRFTSDRKRELEEIGLSHEQILQLEYALEAVRFYSATPPSLSDVRDQLTPLLKALGGAKVALDAFFTKPANVSPAFAEVLSRLILNTVDLSALAMGHPQASLIEDTSAAIAVMIKALEDLRKELGEEQRRGRRSTCAAVAAIDQALSQTWRRSRGEGEGSQEGKQIEVSSGTASDFFKIVSLCYQEVGIDTEPERATKEYVRATRACRRA